MTLDDAADHVNSPVITHGEPTVRSGVVERVDLDRRLVLVRLRYERAPYALSKRTFWYSPVRLSIPQWWLDRTATRS